MFQIPFKVTVANIDVLIIFLGQDIKRISKQ